jgi:hypothetical protein
MEGENPTENNAEQENPNQEMAPGDTGEAGEGGEPGEEGVNDEQGEEVDIDNLKGDLEGDEGEGEEDIFPLLDLHVGK